MRTPLLCAWRCNACECGPCILSTKASDDRPYFCACCHDDEVRVDWRELRTVADTAYDVYAWKEDVGEGWICERNYPDWFWMMISERCERGDEIVAELGAVMYDERFDRIRREGGESDVDRVLKRYTKRELLDALVAYGFKCGLIYSEWRRKADGVEDFEIYED